MKGFRRRARLRNEERQIRAGTHAARVRAHMPVLVAGNFLSWDGRRTVLRPVVRSRSGYRRKSAKDGTRRGRRWAGLR
ncbi:hypothetical protein C7U60_18380 [Mesorhizobium plurifarium]|nr:hypothetical protein C7U60_18380 [Mesorhizobium plurifarium]